MNLDSLSFTLSQISYLVANLNKKNFRDSCQEISIVSIKSISSGIRFFLFFCVDSVSSIIMPLPLPLIQTISCSFFFLFFAISWNNAILLCLFSVSSASFFHDAREMHEADYVQAQCTESRIQYYYVRYIQLLNVFLRYRMYLETSLCMAFAIRNVLFRIYIESGIFLHIYLYNLFFTVNAPFVLNLASTNASFVLVPVQRWPLYTISCTLARLMYTYFVSILYF